MTKYELMLQRLNRINETYPAPGQYVQTEPEKSLAENFLDGLKTVPLTLGALPFTGIGMVAEGLGNAADVVAETFPENSWRRDVMETARDASYGAADISTDALKALAPSPSPGLISSHASGLLGSVGGFASMLHADRVADNLIDESEKLANKNPVPAEFSWEYFTNPNGLRSDAGQLTGSMAAIAPFFVAANTPVGRVVTPAVRAFGGNALERFLIGRGINAATAQRVPQAITNALTYGLTSAPAEGMMEGGHTRREALAQGLSDEEATSRSIDVALRNIPTLMATNTLEGLAMFAPILRAAKGSKLATAAQIAGRGLVNSAQEQTEEALQQGIQDRAMKREYGIAPWNWTEAQWEAASRVKYPAALFGGAGGMYHAIRRPNETPAQENPTPAENSAPAETSTPEKISSPVEDETTKNLLEQFAEEKLVSSEDPTEVEFFDRMFTDKGKFRNTPENRAAILKNFGDEFSAWRKQIETPAETQSADGFLSNPKLFDDARNLLANLREENSGAALELQTAIQTGDAATIEKFLRQYKTTPVENSTPVENFAPEETPTSVENILALPAPKENSAPAENPVPEKISAPAETSTQETAPPTQTYSSPENRGKTAEVITGNRTPHQIQYRVMEADALNSSHTIETGGVFANKNYPAELQPRDRTRSDMQAQLIGMSEKLNPADLLDARDVNQGAPTVRNDGVVLNGNGRVAAIRRAYEIGKGETYKSALVENAEHFGLDADEISRMKNPVLVREITGDLNDEQIRDITGTQTGGVRMGASEQSQADAKKLSSATLSTFPQNDNVDLSNAEAADFLSSAIADIATPDERNALTTSDGKVSQDGINRVKRALFALAYGDDGLIARMSESTDDNIRGVTNALLNAAPTVAKLQAAMKNGTAYNYDLSPIVDAAKKLSSLRDEGKTATNFLQEQSLFAEHKFSDEAREILTFLDRNKRAPNKTAALLKNIAQKIRVQGDPREANLFGGENQIEPLVDIIKRAAADVENRGMENLFDRQETTSQPAPQEVTPKTAIFRRDDKTLPNIPAGRKAIKEAPAGTKVRTLSGQNTETNFVVGEKNIQMLDENEQPIGQAYARNSENMRKIFGSSGVQEIELTYPQEANQNVTTQTTQT